MADDKKEEIVFGAKPAESEEKTEAEKKVDRENERKELLKQLGDTLREFDNRESDIPPGHVYWDNLNRFRALK